VSDVLSHIESEIFATTSAGFSLYNFKNPQAEERYTQSKLCLEEDISELAQRWGRNPERQQQIEQLKGMILYRISQIEMPFLDNAAPEELARAVELRRKTMLSIFQHLTSIRNEIKMMRAASKQEWSTASRHIRSMFYSTLAIGIMGGAVVMYLFVSSIITRIHHLETNALRLFSGKANHKLLGSNDEIAHLDELYEDATDQILVQKEQLHAILSSVKESIYMLNEHGDFVFANPQTLKYLGLPPQAVIGKNLMETTLSSQKKRTLKEGIDKVIREGKTTIQETLDPGTDDQNPVTHERILTPVKTTEGDIRYVVGVSRDISLQKQLIRDLKRARDSSDAMNRAKTEFISNMSHEIRTPLNGILGMLEILNASELPLDKQSCVNSALKSSKRLNQLLANILELAQLDIGHNQLKLCCIDLRDTVEGMHESFAPIAQTNNLRFDISVDESLPEYVEGDVIRLQQVLQNLLGNAFKFTQEGHVALIVVPEPSEDPNSEEIGIRFIIKDSGIGIPNEKLQEIFDIFTQADSSYNKGFEGAGLGLSISKQLVSMMGGSITATSSVNQGSTFSFVVPFEIVKKPNPELQLQC